MKLSVAELESTIAEMPIEEQLGLIERIAHGLKRRGQGPPVPLAGAWKGAFPDDIDIEEEVRGIRDAWKEDLEDI